MENTEQRIENIYRENQLNRIEEKIDSLIKQEKPKEKKEPEYVKYL